MLEHSERGCFRQRQKAKEADRKNVKFNETCMSLEGFMVSIIDPGGIFEESASRLTKNCCVFLILQVSDWWEEYVYLRGRSPIMVNSNYYGMVGNPFSQIK